MGNLDSLIWQSRFLDETPGDPVEGGNPRQVPGVCWSRVKPTETKDPILRLWSQEMAERLGLNDSDSAVLGGSGIVAGMDPYAQRYGGHQFGNWAHQLGDGRAITLGEVQLPNEFLELQLKGQVEHHTRGLPMAKQCYAHRFESSCVVKQCITWMYPQLEPCRWLQLVKW